MSHINETGILTVKNISKIYRLYNKPIDRLKEAFNPLKKKYHHNFYALKNISFSLRKGESLGILGSNGAGKSTLLQIITGVVTPTKGTVTTKGKLSALLELGAGFNPELSGIENIFFKCSLQGFTKSQTQDKLDEILSFADIGSFVNQPVKTYSSGMFVRLAFSVAINVDPDILIIDEALSVGDFRFQQKCFRKLNEFRKNNKTIIFVSHSEQSIIQFCTKCLWILKGEIKQIGRPKDVCKDYISYMSFGVVSNLTQNNTRKKFTENNNKIKKENINWVKTINCKTFGDSKAEILATSLFSCHDKTSIKVFNGGIRVTFVLKIKIHQNINDPIVGFQLNDNKGVCLLGMNSLVLGEKLPTLNAGETKIISFEFDFPMLKRGKYSFSPAIASGSLEKYVQHNWVHDAYLIEIGNKDIIARMGCFFIIKDNVTITAK